MGVLVREEVLLPLRAVPQPEPFVVKGGDCCACVLAGVVGSSVEHVYDEFCNGQREALCRNDFEAALHTAQAKGYIDRMIVDVPIWLQRRSYLPFGNAGHLSSREWFAYVRMAIDAGYYGIASVDFARKGVGSTVPPETDHVVLICGARTLNTPLEHVPGASRLDEEILVSCSARSSPEEEWVRTEDFLAQRGGYNVMLVRPVRQGDA